jgi:hypothetical protein
MSSDVHVIFNGTVVKRDAKFISVRLFPGLTVDVRKEDIEEIEEVEDEVTKRAYVRIRLRPDADVSANFKPRLARLAMAAEGDVPFAFGGEGGGVPHAMPSGGAQPVIPAMDPRGLEVFARQLPPHVWGALAARLGSTVQVASSTTTVSTPTQCTRDTGPGGPTNWQTAYQDPISGEWRSRQDGQHDMLPDYVNDDTNTETQQDGW